MASIAAAGAGLGSRRSHWLSRWKHLAIDTFKVFTDPDTSLRCAGTAFFGFLSLFPAVAIVFLIYGLVADGKTLVQTIKAVDFILPQSAEQLVGEQLLALVAAPPATLGVGLLVSIPLALWSGSRGIDALLVAMARVRSTRQERGFIRNVLISIGMTLGGAVLLAIALVTVAGLPALTTLLWMPTMTEVVLLGVRWPILLAVSVLVLCALYRWGPDPHPRHWRYVWPGALLASILWVLAGVVFSIYVENFGNYQATFGSVTAGVVLLLWLYNSVQIFVLGAAFNAQLERQDGRAPST
jgi:membrane protein